MRSLRRILPEIDLDEDKISAEILQKIEISSEDFRDALKEVRPSALREVQVQIPNVPSWNDVGGLDELKEELREAVEWPSNTKKHLIMLMLKHQKESYYMAHLELVRH